MCAYTHSVIQPLWSIRLSCPVTVHTVFRDSVEGFAWTQAALFSCHRALAPINTPFLPQNGPGGGRSVTTTTSAQSVWSCLVCRYMGNVSLFFPAEPVCRAAGSFRHVANSQDNDVSGFFVYYYLSFLHPGPIFKGPYLYKFTVLLLCGYSYPPCPLLFIVKCLLNSCNVSRLVCQTVRRSAQVFGFECNRFPYLL